MYTSTKNQIIPTIIKQIPKAIVKQISDISSSEVIFNESKLIYSDALRKKWFPWHYILSPKPLTPWMNKKKSHNHKIIWLNPPCCLDLLKKHFHKGNSWNKIFNKNTEKLKFYQPSFRHTKHTYTHNKSIFNLVSNTDYDCDCRSKDTCPQHKRHCQNPRIVHQADVKNLSNNEKSFTLEL